MSALRRCGAALLALLLALALAGCERRDHQVRYEVSGSAARMRVSYQNETGGGEQLDVRGVWTKSITVETWEYVSVTVVNATGAGGVGCRLYVDGRLVERASSSGGYTVARCDTLAGAEATPTR